MIVRLDLEDRVRELVACGVLDANRALGVIGARIEAARHPPLDHRGIVAVGDHGSLRCGRVGGADHGEQGGRLGLAVDGPGCIEDLVTAVLRIGLREHHQLDIGRIAPQLAVGLDQVVDLVIRQGQAHACIGGGQRRAAVGAQRDHLQRLAGQRTKQRSQLELRGQHALGHPVVQQRGDLLAPALGKLARPQQSVPERCHVAGTTLNAGYRGQAAVAGNVGGLARPRRDGPQTRHDEKHLALGGPVIVVAIAQQGGQLVACGLIERAARMHQMHVARSDGGDVRLDRPQPCQQARRAESRQRARTVEREERVGGAHAGAVKPLEGG